MKKGARPSLVEIQPRGRPGPGAGDLGNGPGSKLRLGEEHLITILKHFFEQTGLR